jgi:ribonucleoside-diphosphate reductase alpha chain
LPNDRNAITKKFTIKESDEVYEHVEKDCPHCGKKVQTLVSKKVDLDAYVTVGMYPDGKPGEVFLKVGKAGGVYRVYDALCVAMSIGLQYGIPLSVYVNKFMFMRFEPGGVTGEGGDGVPIAFSIPDYLAKWMRNRFLGPEEDVPAEKQPHGLTSMMPGPVEDNDGRSS